MATPTLWKNVAIAMQSALAASVAITSITKANPGVVTTTAAHGLATGDWIYADIQGMFQLSGRAFRVIVLTTTTFQLEGEDTTAFDTFVSGSVAKLTLGTSVTTVTNVNASGGDFDFIDTTTIHGNQKTQIPGLASPAVYTLENMWDISDAGLKALKKASDEQGLRVFLFTFGTGGKKMVFAGYVGAMLLPGGQGQGLAVTPVAVTMFGSPTYYAS